jgi:hypothetical protein
MKPARSVREYNSYFHTIVEKSKVLRGGGSRPTDRDDMVWANIGPLLTSIHRTFSYGPKYSKRCVTNITFAFHFHGTEEYCPAKSNYVSHEELK